MMPSSSRSTIENPERLKMSPAHGSVVLKKRCSFCAKCVIDLNRHAKEEPRRFCCNICGKIVCRHWLPAHRKIHGGVATFARWNPEYKTIGESPSVGRPSKTVKRKMATSSATKTFREGPSNEPWLADSRHTAGRDNGDEQPRGKQLKQSNSKKALENSLRRNKKKKASSENFLILKKQQAFKDKTLFKNRSMPIFDNNVKAISDFTRTKLKNETKLGLKKYKCDFCAKKFFSLSGKRYHTITIHRKKRWTCNSCGLILSHPSSPARHKEIHEGGATFSIWFERDSGTVSEEISTGSRHVSKRSGNIKKLTIKSKTEKQTKSPGDNESFASMKRNRRGLQNRRRKGEAIKKRWRCEICAVIFSTLEEFGQHNQRHFESTKDKDNWEKSIAELETEYELNEKEVILPVRRKRRVIIDSDDDDYDNESRQLHQVITVKISKGKCDDISREHDDGDADDENDFGDTLIEKVKGFANSENDHHKSLDRCNIAKSTTTENSNQDHNDKCENDLNETVEDLKLKCASEDVPNILDGHNSDVEDDTALDTDDYINDDEDQNAASKIFDNDANLEAPDEEGDGDGDGNEDRDGDEDGDRDADAKKKAAANGEIDGDQEYNFTTGRTDLTYPNCQDCFESRSTLLEMIRTERNILRKRLESQNEPFLDDGESSELKDNFSTELQREMKEKNTALQQYSDHGQLTSSPNLSPSALQPKSSCLDENPFSEERLVATSISPPSHQLLDLLEGPKDSESQLASRSKLICSMTSTCCVCYSNFSRDSDEYREHLLLHLELFRSFTRCPMCERDCGCYRIMTEHFMLVHANVQKIVCRVNNCDRTFWTEKCMQLHAVNHASKNDCSESILLD